MYLKTELKGGLLQARITKTWKNAEKPQTEVEIHHFLKFPYKSCQKMTVQIPFLKNYWVFHTGPLFGKRTSGHPDFGTLNNVGASSILTWVSADTASAACAAHFGSLELGP